MKSKMSQQPWLALDASKRLALPIALMNVGMLTVTPDTGKSPILPARFAKITARVRVPARVAGETHKLPFGNWDGWETMVSFPSHPKSDFAYTASKY